MPSRLDLVIENFREYLRSIKISNIDNEVDVEYTLLAYDYIDDDLDFDEAYYKDLCISFKKWMEATALDMVKHCEVKKVKIVENTMLFRNEDVHAETTSYLYDDVCGYIRVIKEKRVSMKDT